MINILPAVIEITTRQESPQPSAVPYDGGVSPLTEVLERDAEFFDLFGSFEGYVTHFHLDDFVFPDGTVRFLLPFADFAGPTLPTDVASYREYLQQSLALFTARRDRLQRMVRGHA
jgi:hypothetical protein